MIALSVCLILWWVLIEWAVSMFEQFFCWRRHSWPCPVYWYALFWCINEKLIIAQHKNAKILYCIILYCSVLYLMLLHQSTCQFTVEPLYWGTPLGQVKVSWLKRCPHFRGSFVYAKTTFGTPESFSIIAYSRVSWL